MNHRFSCPQIWFSVFPHIIPKYDGRCPHILPENDHFFMSECPDWKQHPGKTPPLLRLGSKWSEALWKAQPGPRGLTTDDGTYGLKAQKIIEISLILGQKILEQFVYWVIYIYTYSCVPGQLTSRICTSSFLQLFTHMCLFLVELMRVWGIWTT